MGRWDQKRPAIGFDLDKAGVILICVGIGLTILAVGSNIIGSNLAFKQNVSGSIHSSRFGRSDNIHCGRSYRNYYGYLITIHKYRIHKDKTGRVRGRQIWERLGLITLCTIQ